MLVRKVQVEDLDVIIEISTENTLSSIKTTQQKNQGFLVSNFSKEQYENMAEESQGFLMAFHEHELDFNLIVNKRIQQRAKNSYVVLKQICIRRDSHKKGYGRRLYEFFMSSIDKDIYLSVVLEPYNEASVHFHNKLGFKQVITVQAEDQLKRGIFYWNNPTNDSHYDKEIVLGQYEFA